MSMSQPQPESHGTANSDLSIHRRFFIGPMPEKVVSQTEAQILRKKKKRGWFNRSTQSIHQSDGQDNLSSIIQEHAFQFFLREGGNEEDWGDKAAENAQEEMLKRWSDSEWGSVWKRRKKENRAPTSRWVGGSFEIGQFLGVNLLDQEAAGSSKHSAFSKGASSSTGQDFSVPSRPSTSQIQQTGTVSTAATEGSFVTAPSQLKPLTVAKAISLSHNAPGSSSLLQPVFVHDTQSRTPVSDSSTAALLPTTPQPALVSRKSKLVHYVDQPATETPLAPSAPPTEVLARTGSAVEDTSAGATEGTVAQDQITWGDVVMRDRMLVRISHSRLEGLGNAFDEKRNRTTSNLRYEDWAEFMVVWRKDRIELYEDYTFPCKEWVVGHKHFAYLIPLKTQTKLSLYSFVDLTFCLTCPPSPLHGSSSKALSIFHRSEEGTNIFVFKHKSRSRAVDWTWQLWRQLGGTLPPYIEVRCPTTESRVKIDIPSTVSLDNNVSMRMFNRENVIALCRKTLKNYRDWEFIIEREVGRGKHIELCWRMETKLDWIWLDDDVDGKKREWAVLYGLALKQSGKSAHLEIRIGEHRTPTLHIQGGSKLHEPPAIEGYVDRIKPNTQIKEPLYLSSHDGNLFCLYPANAQPPAPPGLTPIPCDVAGVSPRQLEVKRGAQQIMQAIGVWDFRSILAVRRAFHLVPRQSHSGGDMGDAPDNTQSHEDNPERLGTEAINMTHSDDEDDGGDDGLTKSPDKARTKMKRSFELLLKTGSVIRFEAYSRRIALEWIGRLRELIVYWKHRHRVDAREEMDLAEVGSHRPRLTPHLHSHEDTSPETPADTEASLPALGSLYNWCVLDGCKAVLKTGKLFTRKGLHGQYKLVQLFLTSGHLIQYHITPKSSLNYRRYKKINLLDAYVTSGYFAALMLPRGQYNASAASVPRRYMDGLEADDPEEDMLFMILHRPQAPVVDEATGAGNAGSQGASNIPKLSAKRKLVVFRTRSKLERDAWCWAINCEIDKLVRAGREREERLREMGGLVEI